MNSIAEFFYMGGTLFMSLVSIAGLLGFVFALITAFNLLKGKATERVQHLFLPVVIFGGSLAFVIGLFGQIIGLYGAFFAIETVGEVSQAMLAGGLKVSSITTLYGFFCFLFLGVLWFLLRQWLQKIRIA